jgi:tripartite-type tricarboxylate transporter receptor subunit TctC
MPNVPTIGQFVPGFEASGWMGIGAPRGTSPGIVDTLNRGINAALADPTFQKQLGVIGGEVFGGTPAEFAAFIAAYTEKWAKVIKFAGIKPN